MSETSTELPVRALGPVRSPWTGALWRALVLRLAPARRWDAAKEAMACWECLDRGLSEEVGIESAMRGLFVGIGMCPLLGFLHSQPLLYQAQVATMTQSPAKSPRSRAAKKGKEPTFPKEVEDAKDLICDLCANLYSQGAVSGTGGGISIKVGGGREHLLTDGRRSRTATDRASAHLLTRRPRPSTS